MEFKGPQEPRPTDLGIHHQDALARFPSPLRLRPVKAANGQWVCLALCLPHRLDLIGRSAALRWNSEHRQSPHAVSTTDWQRRDAAGSPVAPTVFRDLNSLATLQAAMGLPNRTWLPDSPRFADAVVKGAGSGPIAFLAYLHAENPGPGGWAKL
jgi:hypothetical protein